MATGNRFRSIYQKYHSQFYKNEEEWKLLFESGHPQLAPLRDEMLKIGEAGVTRCALCRVPQLGYDEAIRLLRDNCGIPDLDRLVFENSSDTDEGHKSGIRRSKRNEQFCNCCDAYIEAFPGGADIEMPVLITDVRGSTEVLKTCTPGEGAILGLQLRQQISAVATSMHGYMLQDRGDGYMHLFPYGFAPSNIEDRKCWALKNAVISAVRLASRTLIPTPSDGHLQLGIGLYHGPTYIGAPAIDSIPNRLDLVLTLGSAVASIAAHLSDRAVAGTAVIADTTLQESGIDPDEHGWKISRIRDAEVPAWRITP